MRVSKAHKKSAFYPPSAEASVTTAPRVLVSEQPIDPSALYKAFVEEDAGAGGIVTFTGQVRAEDGSVQALVLDHYPEVTERHIEKFIQEAKERWPLRHARVVHRVGHIAPGETVVFVAASADHRRPAFEAADFLMDYLKSAAPFWKKEITRDGARWIEPTKNDLLDRNRWTL